MEIQVAKVNRAILTSGPGRAKDTGQRTQALTAGSTADFIPSAGATSGCDVDATCSCACTVKAYRASRTAKGHSASTAVVSQAPRSANFTGGPSRAQNSSQRIETFAASCTADFVPSARATSGRDVDFTGSCACNSNTQRASRNHKSLRPIGARRATATATSAQGNFTGTVASPSSTSSSYRTSTGYHPGATTTACGSRTAASDGDTRATGAHSGEGIGNQTAAAIGACTQTGIIPSASGEAFRSGRSSNRCRSGQTDRAIAVASAANPGSSRGSSRGDPTRFATRRRAAKSRVGCASASDAFTTGDFVPGAEDPGGKPRDPAAVAPAHAGGQFHPNSGRRAGKPPQSMARAARRRAAAGATSAASPAAGSIGGSLRCVRH